LAFLPDLTDQHLKELGVPLGDGLKMLRAIRELSGPVSASPQPEPRTPDTAKRRQVTVMFSDLVGSTALSARMDREDLHDVISAYQEVRRGDRGLLRRLHREVHGRRGVGLILYVIDTLAGHRQVTTLG
jgi:hypothetical protein